MTTTTIPGAPRTASRAPRPRRDPAVVLWATAGVCWALTLALAVTGGAEAAHHDHVLERDGQPWPLRIALFLAVWVVMLGAMMLPTLVPLARMFAPVSARAGHPHTARAGLYGGYLLVWTAFAPVALLFDSGIHRLVHAWPWLAAHEGFVLAGALLLAGGYQLSPLKNACLTACRDPLGFLWQHYRRGVRGAVALGARHGLWCLGCCWALMLVMFATGVGSLLWMLGLTAVMVAEKTTRWGARLVVPVGAVLVVAGFAVAWVALGPAAATEVHVH
jgi:predicted metal-binding membrane protein